MEGGKECYHPNEDFTREVAEETVLYVVLVNDCTLAALCNEDTSRPSEALDEIVLNEVDVKLCTDAAD